MDLSSFAEYGMAGICLALVLLVYWILKFLFRFLGNHVDHNTEALKQLTVTLEKICTKIDSK